MSRAVAIIVLVVLSTLSTATTAHADELPEAPQAEPWVDVLPEIVDPVTVEPVPDAVAPAGDLLVVNEDTGGLSATGWFLLVLVLVLLTAPGWLLWAVPTAFVALASALGWRAAGHVGRRRLQRRLDLARAGRQGRLRRFEPFPFE